MVCFSIGWLAASLQSADDFITIAILAKDKAGVLPLYLFCLEKQTWPKEKTYLYIRTNNNTDATKEVLDQWLARVGSLYAGIYYDATDIDAPLAQFGAHEWNCVRFKILGAIRQASIDWALSHNSHYFVVDCDNFIKPTTLETLFLANKPIIGPLLRTGTHYSNFHAAVDAHGYLAPIFLYYEITYQAKLDIFEIPVIHCTYFIQKQYLSQMSYDDQSYRYEYVIFSDNARKKAIAQFIDNRIIYGYITFATTLEGLQQEGWYAPFCQEIGFA